MATLRKGADSTPCSIVFIIDFEQVNVSCVLILYMLKSGQTHFENLAVFKLITTTVCF